MQSVRHPFETLPYVALLACAENAKKIAFMQQKRKTKRTAPGIRCWSPTQLLIERLLA